MHYYSLEVRYYPCITVNCPGDSERSQQACEQNVRAQRMMFALARLHGVQLICEYAWPDGSLHMVARGEFSAEEAEGIFCRKGRQVSVKSLARLMTDSEVFSLGRGGGFATIEEKFDLSKEEFWDRFHQRSRQKENFFFHYHKHRDFCSECAPKGRGGPCDEGKKILEYAYTTQDAWMSIERHL